jgi:ketopantoate reductase
MVSTQGDRHSISIVTTTQADPETQFKKLTATTHPETFVSFFAPGLRELEGKSIFSSSANARWFLVL